MTSGAAAEAQYERRVTAGPCDNFLYGLQGRAFGTPSAGPVARIASRGRKSSRGVRD